MKKIGKILCICMLFLGFSMNDISLRAEEAVPETGYTVEGMRFNWKDVAVHIKTKDYGVNEIRINMSQENYTVKNVKSSSKNLRFWTSRTCVIKHYENEEDKDRIFCDGDGNDKCGENEERHGGTPGETEGGEEGKR